MPPETPQFDEKMAVAMFSHALGKLDPNRVTKKELEDFIKAMKQFADNMKMMTEQHLKMIVESVGKAHDNLSGKVDSLSAMNKQEIISLVEKTMNKMMLEHEAMMSAMDAKMDSVEDGKDADEEKIVQDVLAKLPPAKELEPETTDTLMTKLGITQEDITLLRELPKKVSEIASRGIAPSSSGGGRIVKYYDLSDSLNGILKTFSLPSFWRVLDVKLSSVPVLRPTTDWTADGSAMTITFTSQVDAATSLSAGQSCIVIYSET